MRDLTSRECGELRVKFERELGGAVVEATERPDVTEVLINPDGSVRVHRLGGPRQRLKARVAPAMVRAAVQTVAHASGQVVHEDKPRLEAKLPWDGSRFSAQLPPLVDAPAVAIRKHLSHRLSLEDYVTAGRMDDGQRAVLSTAVEQRQNLLIAGSTGSGKTTLVNALMHEVGRVHPHDRVLLIEEAPELQCPLEDHVATRASVHVGLSDLLRAALRMTPDRILLGEVRGPEALVMLQAWNTGHPGSYCTLHANSAHEALYRLEAMALMGASALPRSELVRAVDLVAFLDRGEKGPCLKEVVRVVGVNEGGDFVTEREA